MNHFREIPAHLLRVADYQVEAERHLPAPIWAFLDGAAGDGRTHHRNLAAFAAAEIIPRMLCDLRQASTRIHLAGKKHSHPIFIAPTAAHGLFHPEAELATCEAANATETTWVVSCQADTLIEFLAPKIRVPWWLQMYPQKHRSASLDLIHRAHDAGASGIVLTVDAPLHVFRYREHRAGFHMPSNHGCINLRRYANVTPDGHILGSELLAHAPRWDDVAALCHASPLPIFLKGILAPEDARMAQHIQAAGVIVSNHGGRILDGVPATLTSLPLIKSAVTKEFPILLDGGIRSGTDAWVALSLGASAVLVGRAPLYGLAVGGALGAAHVLQLLRRELEATMALTGSGTSAPIRGYSQTNKAR